MSIASGRLQALSRSIASHPRPLICALGVFCGLMAMVIGGLLSGGARVDDDAYYYLIIAKNLAAKERWLLINKVDLLEPKEADKRAKDIVRRLRWKGRVFQISGATGAGTDALKMTIMQYLDEHPRTAHSSAD